jgi:hypothetical protein
LGNGSDVLFINSKGVRLPFEIERWDADSGSAEVWVTVDTIRGKSDSQYITMLWGNPAALNAAGGSKVFDTANGYQGVWHLNEDPSTGPNAFKDRTSNANHGTPVGNGIKPTNGAIGPALDFDGATGAETSYVKLPNAANLDYHDTVMISCWVSLKTNSPDSFYIVGKFSYCENDGGACFISGYSLFCSSRRTIQLRVGLGRNLFIYLESAIRITDTDWHSIAGIFHMGRMSLFIDGFRTDFDFPDTPVLSTAAGFIGGKSFFGGTGPFRGAIDEVRICNCTRTSDWIKLNYLNQKQHDALVVWK